MKYLEVFKASLLFKGLTGGEISSVLRCLCASQVRYKKGAYIFQVNDPVPNVGLLLSGSLHIIKDDIWGNRNIVAEIAPSELFGETYACQHPLPSEVSVFVSSESTVLFVNLSRIIHICNTSCSFHIQLVHNLLSILSVKNLTLTRKIEHMSKRQIRDKLLSYLSEEALKRQSNTFKIPFNREQLADYLAVDRSALSKALSILKSEKILDYDRSLFHLYPEDTDTL